MSVAEIKEAIERLPIQDRLKLMDWLSLELNDANADKLNLWADRERASGRNRIFECTRAYVAHRKSRRAKSKAA